MPPIATIAMGSVRGLAPLALHLQPRLLLVLAQDLLLLAVRHGHDLARGARAGRGDLRKRGARASRQRESGIRGTCARDGSKTRGQDERLGRLGVPRQRDGGTGARERWRASAPGGLDGGDGRDNGGGNAGHDFDRLRGRGASDARWCEWREQGADSVADRRPLWINACHVATAAREPRNWAVTRNAYERRFSRLWVKTRVCGLQSGRKLKPGRSSPRDISPAPAPHEGRSPWGRSPRRRKRRKSLRSACLRLPPFGPCRPRTPPGAPSSHASSADATRVSNTFSDRHALPPRRTHKKKRSRRDDTSSSSSPSSESDSEDSEDVRRRRAAKMVRPRFARLATAPSSTIVSNLDARDLTPPVPPPSIPNAGQEARRAPEAG